MKYLPLDFYIGKIRKGEKFSLARYGDGEILCMKGKSGGNSNGCKYSPELKNALFESLVKKDDFIYGLQRVLPLDMEWAHKQFPDIEWYDSEVFGEASANDALGMFINEINKYPVTIIGNYSIRDVTLKLFPNRWFIEVPPTNAIDSIQKVMESILWENRFTHEPKVYLFSCGMASNVFISCLHEMKVNGWLIDVGHIWDKYAGSKSRCDLL